MRTPIRIAPTLVALALVAASCSDAEPAPTTSPTTTTTSTTTSTTAAPTTTTEPPGPDLESLLAAFSQTPLRLTYLVRSEGEETTVVVSQDPTANPPAAALIVPEANAKIITIGDEPVFCETLDGACFTVEDGVGDGLSAGLLGPYAGLLLAAEVPESLTVGDPTDVAGRSGVCFTFSPPDAAGFEVETIHQCIDADLGFTLVVLTDDETPIIELVEFGEPLADDFIPSGPVSDTP